ncbi:hypothetical protein J6590_102078, partial [Homalodisca vitripennis]
MKVRVLNRVSHAMNTFQDLVFCRYDKTHFCKLSRVSIHEVRCPAKLRGCPRWTVEIVPCPYNFSPYTLIGWCGRALRRHSLPPNTPRDPGGKAVGAPVVAAYPVGSVVASASRAR